MKPKFYSSDDGVELKQHRKTNQHPYHQQQANQKEKKWTITWYITKTGNRTTQVHLLKKTGGKLKELLENYEYKNKWISIITPRLEALDPVYTSYMNL